MFVFLLVLGGVIAATGIALLGSGVSLQDHTFDPTTATPGAVAAIGGLIVISLAFAVHLLQRIEQVLAASSTPRALRSAEPPAATVRTHDLPQPIPLPVKPKPEPPQQPVLANPITPPAAAGEMTLEQFREKFPTVVRLEIPSPAMESETASLPQANGHAPEKAAAANGHTSGGANGSAGPVRIAAAAEASSPPGIGPDRRKVSVFESFWPKGPRVARQGQAAAAASVPMPMPQPDGQEQVVEPAMNGQAAAAPAQAAVPRPIPAPVSILKSGVVDGMAYTLYSDGSIEAQLPQGTLRFGSITELRNHIEHSS